MKYAKNRVVSVLEGGYSQRALASGAFAHIVGLVNPLTTQVNEQWWNLNILIKVSAYSFNSLLFEVCSYHI